MMEKQLADGLILRSLRAGGDPLRAQLPEFYDQVFAGENEPDHGLLAAWAQDLVSGDHPTVTADDIWCVVDPAQDDRIVSALLLIPQVWRYEDVAFGVGRPEIVATHPDYRRRGLVRALMTVAHERSESLGHLVQGITGIPHYYRQFGYTMAVELDLRVLLPFTALPKLPEGETPQYTLRPATLSDVSSLSAWDAFLAQTSLLTAVRAPDVWRYEIDGKRAVSIAAREILIIVDQRGQGVGYVIVRNFPARQNMAVFTYVVGPNSSYLATFHDVARGLQAYAEAHYADQMPLALAFEAAMHPSALTLAHRLMGAWQRPQPYAWYLRVPNLPRFMQTIAPVLERRLKNSGAHNYTGEIAISFYNLKGLRLRFADGRLAEVREENVEWEKAQAWFPWHLFLNIVFGFQSADEISEFLTEAVAGGKATVLLDALFPKRWSALYGLV
ncbi:MAG: GNAT family N-acetyltransferase [Chloroflexi bacterium]|nr:GNAT family N-acetyltransferase [Chloroflexota bacterium]